MRVTCTRRHAGNLHLAAADFFHQVRHEQRGGERKRNQNAQNQLGVHTHLRLLGTQRLCRAWCTWRTRRLLCRSYCPGFAFPLDFTDITPTTTTQTSTSTSTKISSADTIASRFV
jgi:hypothetical protein